MSFDGMNQKTDIDSGCFHTIFQNEACQKDHHAIVNFSTLCFSC